MQAEAAVASFMLPSGPRPLLTPASTPQPPFPRHLAIQVSEIEATVVSRAAKSELISDRESETSVLRDKVAALEATLSGSSLPSCRKL